MIDPSVRELLRLAVIIHRASEEDGEHWLGNELHTQLEAAIAAVTVHAARVLPSLTVASRTVRREVEFDDE